MGEEFGLDFVLVGESVYFACRIESLVKERPGERWPLGIRNSRGPRSK